MFSWILQMENDEPGFRPASFVIRFGACRIKIAWMKRIQLRFYEELNNYLPEDKRKQSFACSFAGEVTVAILLKAAGVPVSEVDLVLCDSEPVGLDHVGQDGDRIAVYPVFKSLDLRGTTRVRDEPLRRPAFVAGPGLARLATYLRLLGFDTRSCVDAGLGGAASRIESERRILLTRDPPPPHVERVFRIRETRPRHQALQVMVALDLGRRVEPLGRCPRCNFGLAGSDTPVRQCRACGISYSDGPHLRRVQRLIHYLTRISLLTSDFPRA